LARKSNNSDWPYRWDLLLRYRLIEIIALWEGRLTTNALMSAFGIQRQQASRDINTYRKEIAPNNLVYDQQLKGYKPTNDFAPKLTQGTVNEYLHLLNSRADLNCHFEELKTQPTNIHVVQPLLRAVKPKFVRPLIKAAREHKRLEIQYVSLNNPEPEIRVISPHTLVYNGYRWHVRAFCEKNRDFRDFVLSRITDIPDPFMPSEQDINDDIAWNTMVQLKVTPDPRLNSHQQIVIAIDYGMIEQQLIINTRGALVHYYLKLLNLDQKTLHNNPQSQQIVIANLDQLQPWLFHG
jgi:predicted DNA-binding transcriptional regulator YafY